MTAPKILIADDDRPFVIALRTRLESLGYQVSATMDAYQALATATQEYPDLLLLDINMPAGLGLSVEQRLALSDDGRKLPIIYMTGESPESVDREASALGIELTPERILTKPFTPEELKRVIGEALGDRALATERGAA